MKSNSTALTENDLAFQNILAPLLRPKKKKSSSTVMTEVDGSKPHSSGHSLRAALLKQSFITSKEACELSSDEENENITSARVLYKGQVYETRKTTFLDTIFPPASLLVSNEDSDLENSINTTNNNNNNNKRPFSISREEYRIILRLHKTQRKMARDYAKGFVSRGFLFLF